MAQAAQRRLTSIDVSDPHLYQDDTWRPLFAQLRRDDPVHYCEASPFGPYWSVTRYDDIFAVELDHETYSSSSELGGIQVADQPKGQERTSFIRMDPPGHTAQRRTVAPIVAPSNLANFEPLIRQRTCDVLDALPRNETFDWAERVSTDLTNMMLATLFDFLGRSHEAELVVRRRHCQCQFANGVVHSEDERFEEMMKMGAYFRKLWNARADAPPAFDLVSMLAHSEATRNLQVREFIGTIGLLIVGGNDTTRNSMSGGLTALVENPDQFELVRARRELIPNLVSEIIRYHTPVLHMRRTARHDAELAGRRMHTRGNKVVMWYISGNRDESKIDRADEFIIDRAKPPASGLRRRRPSLVGDRLAEQQIRILWEEILNRDLRFEITGPPQRLYSNFIRGIRTLPVRIIR